MTCAEFQRVLPYIIESGGKPEEEQHLRSCPVCGDLVADLKYIAEAAKLLVPLEDPHPRVWSGIRTSLERQGVVPARGRRHPASWGGWAPMAAAAALVVVIALALVLRAPEEDRLARSGSPGYDAAVLAAPGMEPEDEQLLAELEARSPADRATYETNLRYVNSYIQDARQSLDRDPTDDEAWQHLMHAYEQKAMLYEMAISRSLR